LAMAGLGGVIGAFAFNAGSYLVSVAALMLLHEVRPRTLPKPVPIRRSLGVGLRFLWRTPPLRWATGAAALTNLAFAPLAAVMTLFADTELGIEDEAALGVFFAIFSAVGAAGVALAPRLIAAVGLGRAFMTGSCVLGVGGVWVAWCVGRWHRLGSPPQECRSIRWHL
jgi:Na+/melibiose symporter-like transporter